MLRSQNLGLSGTMRRGRSLDRHTAPDYQSPATAIKALAGLRIPSQAPMRHILSIIGWASLLICWALYGERRTLCARAHGRPERFWRAWVAVFDWLLRGREPCHCRAEAERYPQEKRRC